MALQAAFWFYLQPGPGEFADTLQDAKDAVQGVSRNLQQLANDAAGVMAQVVTQDTGDLAGKMMVIGAESNASENKWVVGSLATNRSGREYAYFEHQRHLGSSFFDIGEQYVNDNLFEQGIASINSLY